MSKVSPLVDSLIEAFQCLPGIGPKSAQRMVLHLLERNRNAGKLLASVLGEALESVDKCSNCRIFTESLICQICLNEKRNRQSLKKNYIVVPLDSVPHTKTILDAVWSHRRKKKSDGTVYSHRSRVCTNSSQKVKGHDFQETFSPVVS